MAAEFQLGIWPSYMIDLSGTLGLWDFGSHYILAGEDSVGRNLSYVDLSNAPFLLNL